MSISKRQLDELSTLKYCEWPGRINSMSLLYHIQSFQKNLASFDSSLRIPTSSLYGKRNPLHSSLLSLRIIFKRKFKMSRMRPRPTFLKMEKLMHNSLKLYAGWISPLRNLQRQWWGQTIRYLTHGWYLPLLLSVTGLESWIPKFNLSHYSTLLSEWL